MKKFIPYCDPPILLSNVLYGGKDAYHVGKHFHSEWVGKYCHDLEGKCGIRAAPRKFSVQPRKK